MLRQDHGSIDPLDFATLYRKIHELLAESPPDAWGDIRLDVPNILGTLQRIPGQQFFRAPLAGASADVPSRQELKDMRATLRIMVRRLEDEPLLVLRDGETDAIVAVSSLRHFYLANPEEDMLPILALRPGARVPVGGGASGLFVVERSRDRSPYIMARRRQKVMAPTCPACGQPFETPQRQRSTAGVILAGCTDACHTEHVVGDDATFHMLDDAVRRREKEVLP
jgi:hypothetical protein